MATWFANKISILSQRCQSNEICLLSRSLEIFTASDRDLTVNICELTVSSKSNFKNQFSTDRSSMMGGNDVIDVDLDQANEKAIPSNLRSLAEEAGFTNLAYLGEGGFGITMKGRASDGSWHVLKMQKTSPSMDEEAFESLRQEARYLKSMRHPHIVQFFDLARMKDTLVIDMALMPGGDLWERIFELNVHTGEALKWARQLASALFYMARIWHTGM